MYENTFCWKNKNSNFMMETSDRHHLKSVITVNINRNGENQHCMPPNMIH